MRRNLTTTIVLYELVVKGEQAHQRRCAIIMLCCDDHTANLNDTASATESAEAGHFGIICRTRTAT